MSPQGRMWCPASFALTFTDDTNVLLVVYGATSKSPCGDYTGASAVFYRQRYAPVFVQSTPFFVVRRSNLDVFVLLVLSHRDDLNALVSSRDASRNHLRWSTSHTSSVATARTSPSFPICTIPPVNFLPACQSKAVWQSDAIFSR